MLSPKTYSSLRSLKSSVFRLQGCWQLCLEELLSGSDATATTFLANGCGSLKKALGVEPLFLTPYSADPSLYTQDGMQCIWCGYQGCMQRMCALPCAGSC